MKNLGLIIKREYNAKVRNKSFIIMTFLSPFLMVGLILLIMFLTSLNNEEVRSIAILDQAAITNNLFEDTNNLKYHYLNEVDLETAKTITKEGNYYALLYLPKTETIAQLDQNIQFILEGAPNIPTTQTIENRLRTHLTNLRLQQSGVSIDEIQNARSELRLVIENFEGRETSVMSSGVKAIFGGIAGYLLFMFVMIYGTMVMRSVIEEKTNRIIEIIISSVKPYTLMMGKIIGTSLAGLTQFAIWAFLGYILFLIIPLVLGVQLQPSTDVNAVASQMPNSQFQALINDINDLPLLKLSITFILYFIGGYLLYSSIYAAIGASVDNETDTQQFMTPILIPLLLAMYVGFFSVMDNPHGTVSVVFSYIPLTSPIVMLMRIPFGVALWEIALSLALLFITIALFIWLAAKIYRVGILMYGKKPTYKELYKWLKY